MTTYGTSTYGAFLFGGESAYVTLNSRMPAVSVDIDFTNNPTDTARTWTSVSTRLRELHMRLYRSAELDDFTIGSMSLVLDNRDRALEPLFAASPYSPNVVPRRPIRYRTFWNSVEYERFWGFTTSHSIQWPNPPRDAITIVDAADIGLLLNRDQVLLNEYPEETADDRINRVLDDINVPAGVRTIDTSDATVAAVPALDATGGGAVVSGALQHCQECARSDGGYFFIARNGNLTFHNRRHRLDVLGSPSITFGDVSPPAAGEVPYTTDLVGAADDARLWNQSAVLTADGVREESENTVSSARYWRARRDDIQSLLAKPGDAAARASFITWRYGQDTATLRFPHINVVMIDRTGMDLPALLGADVGTRIRIKRRPPGGGTMIDAQAHIEGISEDVTAQGPHFNTGFDVSPADPILDEWVLGTSTFGTDTYVGV